VSNVFAEGSPIYAARLPSVNYVPRVEPATGGDMPTTSERTANFISTLSDKDVDA
jgi:hypothetical protein